MDAQVIIQGLGAVLLALSLYILQGIHSSIRGVRDELRQLSVRVAFLEGRAPGIRKSDGA